MRRDAPTGPAAAALAALLLAAAPAAGQESGARTPPDAAAAEASSCALPEMRQLDFWIGEWELVSRYRREDGTWTEEAATDSVRAVLGGCALLQEWGGTVDGVPFHGLSLTSYAADRGEWQQAWSDDSGPALFVFSGGVEGDRIVLARQAAAEGNTVVRRQVFSNIRPDGFDWAYEQSAGDTGWTPLWTMRYTRRR